MTGIYDAAEELVASFTNDALGRRIEHGNALRDCDVGHGGTGRVDLVTTRYYYDGANEILETDVDKNGLESKARTYVHGISYVDERLMMKSETTSRPYYYALDRMYDVVMLIDRAGAIVERYCYDAYGQPYTCP